jgi:molecular chaperone DnaJ
MPTKDYYDVLGVARSATIVEIKTAYRALARTHHPDVSNDKSDAELRFKEINEAYEVLSNPNKRAQYDRFGTVSNGAGGFGSGFGPGFGATGFGDIFDMFFGDARGAASRRAGPTRGSDLRYDLEISLEEAFTGTTKEIEFSHLAQCDACNGSGAAPGTMIVPCDRCGATGVMRHVRQTPLGQFVTQTVCTKCNGEGHVVAQPCSACSGFGRRSVERRLSVKVPAGVDSGSRIRIGGSGEAGTRGGPAGDLFVYLSVSPHPIFRRDGLETHVDVPVSFPQAALGAKIQVPSLEGDLELAVPPGTQTGATLRLRGHGMRGLRGTHRGDLHVTIHVVTPAKLSKRQRDLLEAYAEAGGDTIDDRSFFERVREAFRPE